MEILSSLRVKRSRYDIVSMGWCAVPVAAVLSVSRGMIYWNACFGALFGVCLQVCSLGVVLIGCWWCAECKRNHWVACFRGVPGKPGNVVAVFSCEMFPVQSSKISLYTSLLLLYQKWCVSEWL
jgi:hypothetical protein